MSLSELLALAEGEVASHDVASEILERVIHVSGRAAELARGALSALSNAPRTRRRGLALPPTVGAPDMCALCAPRLGAGFAEQSPDSFHRACFATWTTRRSNGRFWSTSLSPRCSRPSRS